MTNHLDRLVGAMDVPQASLYPGPGTMAFSWSDDERKRLAIKPLPTAATPLLEALAEAGWPWRVFWQEDTAGHACVSIDMPAHDQGGKDLTRRMPRRFLSVTWHTRATEGRTLRLFGKLWSKHGHVSDAPSLKAVVAWVTENPWV